MSSCPECGGALEHLTSFCPHCGVSLAQTAATATFASAGAPLRLHVSSASISLARTERLEPGVLLGNRYRIVGLLGRGGTGEVYRADDLTLGQAVALKFLPIGVEAGPRRLERLLAEVRIARQVAHPNVVSSRIRRVVRAMRS